MGSPRPAPSTLRTHSYAEAGGGALPKTRIGGKHCLREDAWGMNCSSPGVGPRENRGLYGATSRPALAGESSRNSCVRLGHAGRADRWPPEIHCGRQVGKQIKARRCPPVGRPGPAQPAWGAVSCPERGRPGSGEATQPFAERPPLSRKSGAKTNISPTRAIQRVTRTRKRGW